MNAALDNYRLGQLESRVAELAEKNDKLEKEIQLVKDTEEKRERARLKWGVGALGSVVMALGGVIWAYRKVIFGGAL